MTTPDVPEEPDGGDFLEFCYRLERLEGLMTRVTENQAILVSTLLTASMKLETLSALQSQLIHLGVMQLQGNVKLMPVSLGGNA